MRVIVEGFVESIVLNKRDNKEFAELLLNQLGETEKVKVKIYSKIDFKVGDTVQLSGKVRNGVYNNRPWMNLTVN